MITNTSSYIYCSANPLTLDTENREQHTPNTTGGCAQLVRTSVTSSFDNVKYCNVFYNGAISSDWVEFITTLLERIKVEFNIPKEFTYEISETKGLLITFKSNRKLNSYFYLYVYTLVRYCWYTVQTQQGMKLFKDNYDTIFKDIPLVDVYSFLHSEYFVNCGSTFSISSYKYFCFINEHKFDLLKNNPNSSINHSFNYLKCFGGFAYVNDLTSCLSSMSAFYYKVLSEEYFNRKNVLEYIRISKDIQFNQAKSLLSFKEGDIIYDEDSNCNVTITEIDKVNSLYKIKYEKNGIVYKLYRLLDNKLLLNNSSREETTKVLNKIIKNITNKLCVD